MNFKNLQLRFNVRMPIVIKILSQRGFLTRRVDLSTLLDPESLLKIVPAGMGSPLELLMESSTEVTLKGIFHF